jgi:hypothetical protein
MNEIKISELFYSIQGEGRYMGVPSVFLRTFGCNFKCQGFGMPRGETSNERFKVDADTIKEYKNCLLLAQDVIRMLVGILGSSILVLIIVLMILPITLLILCLMESGLMNTLLSRAENRF